MRDRSSTRRRLFRCAHRPIGDADRSAAAVRRHVRPVGDEAADDREAVRARRRRLQQQVGQLARRAVGEQQLVAADSARWSSRRSRLDAPVAVREALADLAVRGGANTTARRRAARVTRPGALPSSPFSATCRQTRQRSAGPSTTSMSSPSACGALRASLRTSMRPPAWRRSSGSRRAPSRTPTARRAGARRRRSRRRRAGPARGRGRGSCARSTGSG